jgi:tol-pal system protein YbgF
LSTQRHIGPSLGAALVASLLLSVPAAAEPAAPGGDTARQIAQARTGQSQPAIGATEQAPPQAGADSALKQRVEQLEEQLVDMQVVVGTLESLARGGTGATSSAPSGNAPSGFGGDDDPRIDGLETQVRALAAQIEQLTAQVRALASAPRRTDASDVPPPAPGAQPAAPGPETRTAAIPEPDRFGSTTVTAGKNDAIGGLIDSQGEASPPPQPGAPGSETVATTPPAFMPPPAVPADAGNPKQLYETAYGYLMQRDYGAAQAAFEDFLSHYPKDSLAGNAQYWLGEAHFVRGEYKAAAGAFLKGYQNYSGNARAADSLLKLAMSLDRLGQKDAACTSFAELNTRFPDAPDNVKSRASTERQRIGCP